MKSKNKARDYTISLEVLGLPGVEILKIGESTLPAVRLHKRHWTIHLIRMVGLPSK
jgi:hypothetical protein